MRRHIQLVASSTFLSAKKTANENKNIKSWSKRKQKLGNIDAWSPKEKEQKRNVQSQFPMTFSFTFGFLVSGNVLKNGNTVLYMLEISFFFLAMTMSFWCAMWIIIFSPSRQCYFFMYWISIACKNRVKATLSFPLHYIFVLCLALSYEIRVRVQGTNFSES